MKFNKIPDILMCRDRKIFVIVEGRRPHSLLCDTASYMMKMCPGRKPVPPPATSKEVEAKNKPRNVPDSHGEWKEVTKKGSKVTALSPIHQEDVQ